MIWEDKLRKICSLYMYEPTDSETLASIERVFKLECPGNYTLQWNDDSDINAEVVELVFKTKEEHLLFILKYS